MIDTRTKSKEPRNNSQTHPVLRTPLSVKKIEGGTANVIDLRNTIATQPSKLPKRENRHPEIQIHPSANGGVLA